MPKFFFDVTDGSNKLKDREGVALKDRVAADAFAADLSHNLVDDGGYDDFYVEVRDQNGERLGKVYVSRRH